jgi:hypothetical protein
MDHTIKADGWSLRLTVNRADDQPLWSPDVTDRVRFGRDGDQKS